jgi:hypothetical protein
MDPEAGTDLSNPYRSRMEMEALAVTESPMGRPRHSTASAKYKGTARPDIVDMGRAGMRK